MRKNILFQIVAILIFQTANLSLLYSQDVLTLDICIDLALKNNHLIKITEKKLVEAQGKKQEAFGHFLPSLSASGSYTRIPEVPSIMGFQMGDEDNYAGKLSLTQPLFTWGKIRTGNRTAALNYDLAAEEFCRVKNETVFSVTKSFYSVLLAREFLKIAEESVEIMEQHYRVIQGFYKEGKVSSVDVSRVKVQLVNARTKRIKADNGLRLAGKALYNLIDQPEQAEMEIKGDLSALAGEFDKMSLTEYINQATENRPEVKQLTIKEKMVKGLVKLARAENRPNLAAVGNYEYKKPYNFEDKWDGSWNAGCYLTFPLFNGLSNWGKIKQAKAQLEQVEIAGDQLRKGIKLEVEKVYLDLKEATERIEAQEENVKAAKENLAVIQNRYEKGLVSDLDLRETQLALTHAQTEYSQALFDYNVALAGLNKAVGK